MAAILSNPAPPGKKKGLRGLPPSILALGVGSMLMDTSSELVHSLLPIYMTTVLGAGMVTVGLIEGVAEATAAATKVFSGVLSDWTGKRKFGVVLGYALAAATKPVFPLARSLGWVFTARFVDRIGKGIRGAPWDALVTDITPPSLRGAAFGFRQALDSVGAALGPLLALILMALLTNDIRAVLWWAVVPAVLTVVLLATAVKEPEDPPGGGTRNWPIRRADMVRLPARFWMVVLLGGAFTLARFSEAFLVLRAQSVGLAIGFVPLVMIVMNVVYAGVSYPAGRASDRADTRHLLLAGLGVLVAADAVLALAEAPWAVLLGAVLWGLHMGLTQGLLSKLVADKAPKDLRGTAFGLFNLVNGGALLLASVIAGELWSRFGPSATFVAGGVFAAVAALGLAGYGRR